MDTRFRIHLDRWIVATLRDKVAELETTGRVGEVKAADYASMLADYVLFTVAQDPASSWTACGLDFVPDTEIMSMTLFPVELLAAGYIGAVCELAAWEGDDGIAFMIDHGVEPDDAREVAQAVELVAGKLGERGRTLLQLPAPVHRSETLQPVGPS